MIATLLLAIFNDKIARWIERRSGQFEVQTSTKAHRIPNETMRNVRESIWVLNREVNVPVSPSVIVRVPLFSIVHHRPIAFSCLDVNRSNVRDLMANFFLFQDYHYIWLSIFLSSFHRLKSWKKFQDSRPSTEYKSFRFESQNKEASGLDSQHVPLVVKQCWHKFKSVWN